ncbi:porin [uncultured Microbulbifer sp.]|uniref:OprO/OprP family phosphate-selective porin n=1 Tax=uncultured Microbulbifer sp. TaxID=348147 RepID=UPI00263A0AE1|nr:porin [uncultured Microbulbifer sp.]
MKKNTSTTEAISRLTLIVTTISTAPAVSANEDVANTKGQLEIQSRDGNLSASLGGMIHYDLYAFAPDIANPTSTTEFRRARIILKGKIYDWQYVLEQDFAAGNTLSGFRNVYLARTFPSGELHIGQFKPFRSMTEMTNSNDYTMIERPFSGNGLYENRQFQQGIGWLGHTRCLTYGLMAFNLRDAAAPRNEGVGMAGRTTWTPINDDLRTIHFGTSVSFENANQNSEDLPAEIDYAGRRGPQQQLALTPGNTGAHVTTAGLELAGTYGPLYAQAEYVVAQYQGNYYLSEASFIHEFDAPAPFPCDPATGCYIRDQNLHSWYVQGSWMLTGEHKPYVKNRGVFKAAKPALNGWLGGTWEIALRYDVGENRDIPGLQASSTILGLNYYPSSNVRFMLNLTFGDDDFTGDSTNQLGIRAQIHW